MILCRASNGFYTESFGERDMAHCVTLPYLYSRGHLNEYWTALYDNTFTITRASLHQNWRSVDLIQKDI